MYDQVTANLVWEVHTNRGDRQGSCTTSSCSDPFMPSEGWPDGTACLQGCTFVNQYVVVKTLGQGAYGKVKLCLNSEDHNLYALKLVSKVRGLCTLSPHPALPCNLCHPVNVLQTALQVVPGTGD